jgi:hypothetical protein
MKVIVDGYETSKEVRTLKLKGELEDSKRVVFSLLKDEANKETVDVLTALLADTRLVIHLSDADWKTDPGPSTYIKDGERCTRLHHYKPVFVVRAQNENAAWTVDTTVFPGKKGAVAVLEADTLRALKARVVPKAPVVEDDELEG